MYIMFDTNGKVINENGNIEYVYFEESQDIDVFIDKLKGEIIIDGLTAEKTFYYFDDNCVMWKKLTDDKKINVLRYNYSELKKIKQPKEIENCSSEKRLDLFITFSSGETIKTNNTSLTAKEISETLEFLINSKVMGENITKITIEKK